MTKKKLSIEELNKLWTQHVQDCSNLVSRIEQSDEKLAACAKNVLPHKTYPDGSIKTFQPGKPHLNRYGYSHRETPCPECGKYECDPNGIGHYRG